MSNANLIAMLKEAREPSANRDLAEHLMGEAAAALAAQDKTIAVLRDALIGMHDEWERGQRLPRHGEALRNAMVLVAPDYLASYEDGTL